MPRVTHALGLIGSGNMAEAIARGVLRAGVLSRHDMIAADITAARRAIFAGELGIRSVEDNADAARGAKMVLLSVKPQQMAAALQSLASVVTPDTLFISIAAGISAAFIERSLGGNIKWRVIRTMPNTPMLVGQGMVAIARGSHASQSDAVSARALFESAARVVEVPESQIDAVTAVSGSGPAYVFYLIEQMIAAGVALGLDALTAHTLAVQTAKGAAGMLSESHESPAELRRRVTSPGGTTQAAISVLDQQHVGQSIIDAVSAAAARSKALGL